MIKNFGRRFRNKQYIKNVLRGRWLDLYDENDRRLTGIQGRIGIFSTSDFGEEIGVDMIRMRPRSYFPLHTHQGDHILYVQEGPGIVHISGRDYFVNSGDTIYIPAIFPHGLNYRRLEAGGIL
ncbi:MAG: cupin domain-containing protein [Candidatus Omnitrophica bacterium]|nr:cupin domain-containing protein [Candidatus Omnitrophota bacterium]